MVGFNTINEHSEVLFAFHIISEFTVFFYFSFMRHLLIKNIQESQYKGLNKCSNEMDNVCVSLYNMNTEQSSLFRDYSTFMFNLHFFIAKESLLRTIGIRTELIRSDYANTSECANSLWVIHRFHNLKWNAYCLQESQKINMRQRIHIFIRLVTRLVSRKIDI